MSRSLPDPHGERDSDKQQGGDGREAGGTPHAHSLINMVRVVVTSSRAVTVGTQAAHVTPILWSTWYHAHINRLKSTDESETKNTSFWMYSTSQLYIGSILLISYFVTESLIKCDISEESNLKMKMSLLGRRVYSPAHTLWLSQITAAYSLT